MSVFNPEFVNRELSKKTSILGLRLSVVIGVVSGAVVLLLLFFLFFCCITASRRRRRLRRAPRSKPHLVEKLPGRSTFTPVVSKEIQPIVPGALYPATADNRSITPAADPELQIDMGVVDHREVYPDRGMSNNENMAIVVADRANTGSHGGGSMPSLPDVSHLGWGRWFTLRDLENATDGFSDQNVIGEGGYGIVYYGLLADNTEVAIKNILNKRDQAEKEFTVEVEAIGRVRHKNLVRLLGYCVEGDHRMLVYEYIDNGNLDQWLHGEVGNVSPLTWDIRMNIILGTARGLSYLHEGLEPKVVHRDVKSGNILLDRQWNPKLSDFGLAKLLNSENSYVSTRVMGTFGYVAPEYASTGMLTEKSDVYSFGILIMEIITGRLPVDYTRPSEEVNLIDWLKMMVGSRRSEEVVDPKLAEQPPSKALKRVILVALRCVDPDAHKRPKIGHVISMLESENLLTQEDRQIAAQETSSFIIEREHPRVPRHEAGSASRYINNAR